MAGVCGLVDRLARGEAQLACPDQFVALAALVEEDFRVGICDYPLIPLHRGCGVPERTPRRARLRLHRSGRPGGLPRPLHAEGRGAARLGPGVGTEFEPMVEDGLAG